jgi:hypothetical protein
MDSRRCSAVLVTTNATANLAGLKLDDAAHALDLVEFFVQQMKVEYFSRRRQKASRTIWLDGDHSKISLGHETRPSVRAGDLVGGSRIIVLKWRIVLNVASVRPSLQVRSDLLGNTQILHVSARHRGTQSLINIRDQKLSG